MADDKPAGKDQPDRAPTLAEAARVLVKDANRGILCTLIPEGGFPYGSLTELLPLPDGDIVLFLSPAGRAPTLPGRGPASLDSSSRR